MGRVKEVGVVEQEASVCSASSGCARRGSGCVFIQPDVVEGRTGGVEAKTQRRWVRSQGSGCGQRGVGAVEEEGGCGRRGVDEAES